jgi:hypothetical protein
MVNADLTPSLHIGRMQALASHVISTRWHTTVFTWFII